MKMILFFHFHIKLSAILLCGFSRNGNWRELRADRARRPTLFRFRQPHGMHIEANEHI